MRRLDPKTGATKVLSVRLTPGMAERLSAAAEACGLRESNLVRHAVAVLCADVLDGPGDLAPSRAASPCAAEPGE